MSKLTIEVKKIDHILPHTNADRLELAQIGAWQSVIKKGKYKQGDIVVFVPPDSVIPQEVAEANNCAQYLKSGNRSGSVRLRGEPSHGIILDPLSKNWRVGDDVAEFYGITKYIAPPTRRSSGGGKNTSQDTPHPLFVKYTDIENLRHNPNIFKEGEEVVVTEKIHGSSSRIGIIEGVMMAGSRNFRRKPPWKSATENFLIRFLRKIKMWKRPVKTVPAPERWSEDWYWMPWTTTGAAKLMSNLSGRGKVAMAFGETFGFNVQKGVHYGTPDKIGWRCFDTYVDGKFLDYDDHIAACKDAGVETVPEIWRGPYTLSKIKELSEGRTLVNGATHIREGVVVRPVKERREHRHGRIVFKYVSDSYLIAKETGDFGDDDEESSDSVES